MWRKFICASVVFAIGCESAPQKSPDELPDPVPAEQPESSARSNENDDSASAAKDGQESPGAEIIPLPVKVLEALPLMEEYHSLSMVWNGTGDTSRVLYSKPERDASPVGKIEINDKTLDAVESLDQMVMRVVKPRAFTAKEDTTWRVDAGEGDQEVAIKTGDSVYLYAYQGEGMCEVGFRDGQGKPVMGVAVCPGSGEGEWTTSPGNDQLAEGIDWWFKLENTEGVEGWVLYELSELDLKLVQSEDL